MRSADLHPLHGLDIMLVDLLVRGVIPDDARVFDAGCGTGRNLRWFLQAGHAVAGCDSAEDAVLEARALVRNLRPDLDAADCITHGPLDADIATDSADLVIANAVLHFAPDAATARQWLDALWARVAPGGLLFIRLASRIAWRHHPACAADGSVTDPECDFGWLPDLHQLEQLTLSLDATLAEPIKSVDVHGARCMTTWILRRSDDWDDEI